MDDLISRQTAIELIHSLYPSTPIMRKNRERWEKKYKPYIECEKALEMLPSAQPDFDIIVKIDKAYDDGYEAGYLQGRHDWGDWDE